MLICFILYKKGTPNFEDFDKLWYAFRVTQTRGQAFYFKLSNTIKIGYNFLFSRSVVYMHEESNPTKLQKLRHKTSFIFFTRLLSEIKWIYDKMHHRMIVHVPTKNMFCKINEKTLLMQNSPRKQTKRSSRDMLPLFSFFIAVVWVRLGLATYKYEWPPT